MRQKPELVDDDEDDHAAPSRDDWTVEVEGSPYKFPLLAKFGIGSALACLILIASIALVPMVLPASMTIKYAENIIGRIVGIDVSIKGGHSFKVLPSLHLNAEQIVQADPKASITFSLKQFDVDMSALGALSGSVDVNRISFIEPQFLVTRQSAEKVMPEKVPTIDKAWGWWRDMSLNDVTIKDAVVAVADLNGSRLLNLVQFSLMSTAPEASDPQDGIVLKGQGLLNGQKVGARIMTSDPQLLVSGNRWPVNISISSQFLDAAFTGSLAMRERMVGDGKLEITSTDALSLNNWIGPFLPTRGPMPVRVSADIAMAGDTIDVTQISADYAETSFVGSLQILRSKPLGFQITGNIDATTIDLGTSLGDMSDEINDTPLPLHNIPVGKIDLSWQRAYWHDVEMGLGRATIERPARSDRIRVSIDDTSVYGGKLRGDITLDTSEGMQALHVNARAVGVAAGPFLKAGKVAYTPVLDGKATLEIGLFSVGGTMRQLMEALTGTAELVATNGIVVMPRLIAEISPGSNDGLRFKSLNGNFKITQGIAASDDLLLRTDDLSLVGKGRIDLANGTLDLDVGRLNSEGGERTLKRYRVSGPTSDIQVEAVNGS